MRLLIVDPTGNALDFAMRSQRDGHEVKMFIFQNEKTKNIGRGLVEIVDDFKTWFRWADIVFASDNTKYLRDFASLSKDHAIPLISPNEESAAWELDRKVGQDVFKKHHIPTIPSKEFSDYDSAIAHVKKHDTRFVSKPWGGSDDKALSYVSQSPADMIYMLERWKKLGKLKSAFLLQEFVPGVEMAVGGWFGPGGFNEGWCENFEFKKLMNDDLGPATGEQGTVLRNVKTSKLARKVLAPLENALAKLNYVGYVDVNTIIDDKGNPWPLEFTMRPGWPTFCIQEPLRTGDSVEWLMNLAKGLDSRNLIYDRIAVGVVLSIPDYPYSHLTRKEVVGVPIYGLTESLWKSWHPCEMKMGDDVPNQVAGSHIKMPMPVTAGDYVGVMTATGNTVKDAALSCYRRLEKLIVPNSKMWRSDIGKRLAKQLPQIQKYGYATGIVYSPTS
jgi:phosphoribosylamine--glycine ligase